jgi:glycosyltransferase involved in cell wall biosynthesis
MPGEREIDAQLLGLRAALSEGERIARSGEGALQPAQGLSGFLAALKSAFDAAGWSCAQERVERQLPDRYQCAAVLTELAKLCRSEHPATALELGRRAQALDPRPFRAKWLSFVAFDAGQVGEAAQLLNAAPRDLPMQASEARKAAQIQGCHRLMLEAPRIPRRWPRAYEAVPRSLLYVASSCQPFHLSGYTVRTQALLKATASTPWKVTCVARPGYPWDRMDALAATDAQSTQHAEVGYRFIRGAHLSAMPPDAYISTAASLIESAAQELRPAVIQAASNHMTALPALIAARRLGVPFVYEVRGLWEITAASGKADWERSERFQLASRLEALAACNADLVFTLTRQLSAELQARGVEAARIHLLPNGADLGTFAPDERDRGLLAALGLDPSTFTIGYAGAIKQYEGLDDLISAIARLRHEGRAVQAVIVGEGDRLRALRAQCADLGLDETVKLVGRQPPEAARAYLRAADLAAVPRKRLDVGEVVSPLKQFEVMALGTPLVISDVAPLADIARDSGNAVALFEASNPDSLATEIARLMDDPARRRDLATRAREYVARRNSWEHIAGTMAARLDEVDADGRARDGGAGARLKGVLHFLRRLGRGGRTQQQRRRIASDIALLGNSGLFDAAWYLQRYPDVASARANPLEHYLHQGATEARDPGPGFDTRWYLDRYPDVARSGMNPLVHYLRLGMSEGRAPRQQ